MEARVIVTHGTKGSPERAWFPWLGQELEKRDVEVIIPTYPTPDGQSLESWIGTLKSVACELREGDLLVGHSIGAAFVLRLLERSAVKIRGTFLVAGFARSLGIPDYDPLNSTFVEPPFDWKCIRQKSELIVSYSSDDDPYVPIAFAKELAGALCVNPVIIEKAGHFNADSGYTSFPRLLEDILKILSDTGC